MLVTRFIEVPSTSVNIGLPSIRTSTAGWFSTIILGGVTSSSRAFSLSFCAVSRLSRRRSSENVRSRSGICISSVADIFDVSASAPFGNLICLTFTSSSRTVLFVRSVVTRQSSQTAPNTGSVFPSDVMEMAARALRASPLNDSICG